MSPAPLVAQAPNDSNHACRSEAPSFATPHCTPLVPVPGLEGVGGVLFLRWVPTPFGVAVRPDGQLRHALEAEVRGLPSHLPGQRAPVYIAWGYDLTHRREVKLARVRNGTNTLGELPFEFFRVLVSAERSERVETRSGPLVLRATSPNTLMLSHRDAMAPMMGGADVEAHAGHDRGWPMLPDDPRIAPTMAHASPNVLPWQPDTVGRRVVDAKPRAVVDVSDGDTVRLEAGIVRRALLGRTRTMYGYNGQYPGPLLRVTRRTHVVIELTNALDLPTTIHWHGVRLDNASDGVPHLTQEPVLPGERFTYHLTFPDAGIYWYHPHVREDIQQELGLYGNVLVRTSKERIPANREEVLALDDVLLAGEQTTMPFGGEAPTHALMGRFGNVMLVNGEPRYALTVRRGEVVRLYITNVANARSFNLTIPGATLKLVGGDLGLFTRAHVVQSIVIGPAERWIVDVRFPRAGGYALLNSVRWLDHMRGTALHVQDTLGTVEASGERATPNFAVPFAQSPTNRNVVRELAPYLALANQSPRHTLILGMRMTNVSPNTLAMLSGMAIPVDWNDAMPAMNFPLTGREVLWTMRDEAGRVNMDIAWQFKHGELVKIRVVNDPAVTHAMAHPIHLHGQRFLVVSRNGSVNPYPVWKDTALLPAGEEMELLVEMTNPGRWMMHCHVAEHLGTGMMGTFEVAR